MSANLPFILFAAAVVISIFIYNSLIGKKNQVINAESGIDVQLKKRYDLIPNLVATAKQYMKHEADVLTRVTELRSKALDSDSYSRSGQSTEQELSLALKGLNVAVENYPELKANENFLSLQSSLNEIEGQLSAARRSYNASVTNYNDAIQMFPGNLFAGFMGLKLKETFEASVAERENPNLQNLFNS